ncbi:MAG TPA: LytTR family DNA-binding domain-containing protein [Leadbetterella sp.]|nr:LytTR family DNA-binding domain-containing protein [Leadbetterella sp.]
MKTPKILKNLNQESICYLESSVNYTLLFFQDGKSVISGYNIKVFEKIFQKQDFVKINRSKLVNVAFIKKTFVNQNNYAVQMLNGEEINISRRRLNKIKELYPMIF